MLPLMNFNELCTEVGGMNTEISCLPDTDEPWRSRFDGKSLAQEENKIGSCPNSVIEVEGF
jgi:hypothetical protein